MADEELRKIGLQPPHPGDFIKTEILDELHLSVARAAEILGVRRATLSDLIHGKASLSPEMALRIEKAFGVKMEALLTSRDVCGKSPMQACASRSAAAGSPRSAG